VVGQLEALFEIARGDTAVQEVRCTSSFCLRPVTCRVSRSATISISRG
jgi:hypothetical protein